MGFLLLKLYSRGKPTEKGPILRKIDYTFLGEIINRQAAADRLIKGDFLYFSCAFYLSLRRLHVS